MVKRKRTGSGRNVRLRPANSFDLIRLIAHSQSDARKAVAELVQNSLDAGATRVTVVRHRRRGELALSVFDNGHGVFPELARPVALERIATNIGHSFKRNLSAAERQQQMMLGKYGIGILGFWCVGRELEMRSRVEGSDTWALGLVRDQPLGEVRKVPQSRVAADGETWTEVVIRGLHAASARQLTGRRLGEYLGSELRGQLLARRVKLRMVDRVARGKAPKDFLVVPRRFQGRRIDLPGELGVPGFSPARLELYLVDAQDDRRGEVALTCGGTVVCDDLGGLEGHELDPRLWSAGRLEGIVEFTDFEVSPSTRRGFVPGPAADALFTALRRVEPALADVLAREDERRSAEEDENLTRQIRKVFRPLVDSLPQYDFFDIEGERRRPEEPEEPAGEKLGHAEPPVDGGADIGAAEEGEVLDPGDQPEPPAELFPPGPLEEVRISPKRSRLLPGATRGLRARPVDAEGRTVEGAVELTWTLAAGEGSLSVAAESPDRAVYTAAEQPGTSLVHVEARQGDRVREADALIEVVDRLGGDRDAGIPEPRRVYDPEGDWRSRINGRVWEYNAAHPDYGVVADDPRLRFRYLVHLFAKEIVLRNFGQPADERLLERMVEVLTHIKRGHA